MSKLGYDTFDKERVHFNIARLRRGGGNFEIDIDPDMAMKYKEKKIDDIRDVLKSEHIFADVKKGLKASEHQMENIFGTKDVLKIAEIILREGEVQVSQEWRNKIREEKKRRIIQLIHQNGIDPRTNTVHPIARIENAFEEAKVRIDEYRSAEDQVQDIIKKLMPILPIKIENKTVVIKLTAQHAPKCIRILRSYGTLKQDNWTNDGHYIATLELPAGMVDELFDKLNSITHGSVESRII